MPTASEATSVVPLAARPAPPVPAAASAELRDHVLAARRGDAAAFCRLHALHGRMVHALVLRRAPPRSCNLAE